MFGFTTKVMYHLINQRDLVVILLQSWGTVEKLVFEPFVSRVHFFEPTDAIFPYATHLQFFITQCSGQFDRFLFHESECGFCRASVRRKNHVAAKKGRSNIMLFTVKCQI